MEIVKYLHENGCPWDSGTCKCAAKLGHLDILNILKTKSDAYKNTPMKRRMLEDEAIFLENNKERLRKIREDREIEIDIGESSEEENSSSDFVDINKND